ncbi:uncharacterized protein nrg3b [Lampris incognitus]|uniref:uncharacterized protein nrg3b n=1 Tax=Lampris incognitus TaxID=2546036 RepID=UPI0024B4963C|nr:uncharacterized protein nrg3b [Lampris incognitus]
MNHQNLATKAMLQAAAPTLPGLRSEVFKPCVEDKDLAFCLNEGECSIIQTVAGVHRHCRCKEGYHGLRCDQFVPKTDAILSDPMDELGIEFMGKKTFCWKHREKLRAHFSESRSLRDCSVNVSGLMSKSTAKAQYSLQLQKSCSPHGSSVEVGSVAPGTAIAATPLLGRALSKGERFRSGSLSLSPAQQRRESHLFRTPPISRGKHNLIDRSRVAGHVYKHLQEVETTDMEAESSRKCDPASGRAAALLSKTSVSHFAARKGWVEVPCTRLDKGTIFLPSALRTRSVPIIPSLQACDLEGGQANADHQQGEGHDKWHHALARNTMVSIGSPPSCPGETVALPAGIQPSGSSPTAATTSAKPGSEKGSGSTQIEITVELEAGLLKHKSLSTPVVTGVSGSPAKLLCGITNTLAAVTVPEAKRKKKTRYTPRLLHTGSGVRASGQRDARGLCHGQTPQESGDSNCTTPTRGPNDRGPGCACAKPSAS